MAEQLNSSASNSTRAVSSVESDRSDRQPTGKPTVKLDWGIASYHGWGVVGLNMMLSWAARREFSLCCSTEINPAHLELNPIERWVVDQILIDSHKAHERLRGLRGTVRLSCVVLHALGNNLIGGS